MFHGKFTFIVISVCGFWYILGLGSGCLIITAPVIIVNQFEKDCTVAMGIVSAGGGLGIVVFQQLQNYFKGAYGWRGSLLIMGAISLHTFLGALVIRYFRKTDNGSKHSPVTNGLSIIGFTILKNWRFLVWLFCVFLFAIKVYVCLLWYFTIMQMRRAFPPPPAPGLCMCILCPVFRDDLRSGFLLV